MNTLYFLLSKGRTKVMTLLFDEVNSHSTFLICLIEKDCDRNGDRMSKNDEKLPYLHLATKKLF